MVRRYLPGAAFLAYLTATVLLFFFGPWLYPLEHIRPLVRFLVFVHLALATGYVLGVRATPRPAPSSRIAPLALICVVCELALLPPTSLLNTGAWIPNPFLALTDLGGAYLRSLEIREHAVPWVNYVRIAAAPRSPRSFRSVSFMLYYMPAHNKTMHSGEGVVAFGVLLAAWLVSRRHSLKAARAT
jgi:uncharacterized protein (TIGR03382 family)